MLSGGAQGGRLHFGPCLLGNSSALAGGDWTAGLSRRHSHLAAAPAEAQATYRAAVLDGRARAHRRFGLAGLAARGSDVANDTGLPPQSVAGSRKTCINGAKNIPGACADSVLPWCRGHDTGIPDKATRATASASETVRCMAPIPSEEPEPLQNVSNESVRALAQLEVDVGPHVRAANNFCSSMRGPRRVCAVVASSSWRPRPWRRLSGRTFSRVTPCASPVCGPLMFAAWTSS